METKDVVLSAIKKARKPLSAGDVVALTNLDRKLVDKAMKQLKDSGDIISPKRCYWEPQK